MKKPTKRQQEYWDKNLIAYGLGEKRGTSKKSVLVGSIKNLAHAEENLVFSKTGRVRPKGKGPE